MKVRLIVTVDVDPVKWEREYGDKPDNSELWSYFYDHLGRAIVDSGANFTIRDWVIR